MGETQSAMGRVRTRTTKRPAKIIVEKYYQRLTMDFQTNKKICDEVASIQSKRLRYKIAGFLTHLMKRISRGPVRGISLKLQAHPPPPCPPNSSRRVSLARSCSALSCRRRSVSAAWTTSQTSPRLTS